MTRRQRDYGPGGSSALAGMVRALLPAIGFWAVAAAVAVICITR